MPDVIEPDSPNGFPIAAICSPTLRFEESPIVNGCNNAKSAFTLITARSVNSSVPIISALYDLPSRNVMTTFCASSITCSFVMMCPCLSNTKPEPTPPVSETSPLWTLTQTTPGSDFSNISINDNPFE